jgi:hypothetical protein
VYKLPLCSHSGVKSLLAAFSQVPSETGVKQRASRTYFPAEISDSGAPSCFNITLIRLGHAEAQIPED